MTTTEHPKRYRPSPHGFGSIPTELPRHQRELTVALSIVVVVTGVILVLAPPLALIAIIAAIAVAHLAVRWAMGSWKWSAR